MRPLLIVPAEIAAKARPCPHSVPLIRKRRPLVYPKPFRPFWVALAVVSLVWIAFIAWGASDFHAIYGDKDIKWCAFAGEKLVCR